MNLAAWCRLADMTEQKRGRKAYAAPDGQSATIHTLDRSAGAREKPDEAEANANNKSMPPDATETDRKTVLKRYPLPRSLYKNVIDTDTATRTWPNVIWALHSIGILRESDVWIVEQFCYWHAIWRKAVTKTKSSGGEVITTKGGNTIYNNWFTVVRTSSENMRKFASDLGLSPSDRSAIIKRMDDA